jgi:hypothetical protein
MASLGDELKRLRRQIQLRPDYVAPMEVQVHLKQLERFKCREAGVEPSAYTESELRYLYFEDLADAAGEGTVAHCRDQPGWSTEEGETLLDAWQQEAQQRVQLVAELGGDWRDVYNEDLVDEAQKEGVSIFDRLENERNERKTND